MVIYVLIYFSLGLFLFILGMHLIKSGLEAIALKNAKKIISKFTNTPLSGMITGTFVTFFIQSSSAVSVITISLVNSSLMTLQQAVGVILGTNIGTCITALLFTFDILDYYPFIGAGGLLLTLIKNMKIRLFGVTIIGFSLVFAGLITMQQGFLPLKDSLTVISLLAKTGNNYLSGVAAGAIFTALIQSSSVVTGIIIALAMQDLLPLPGAIALILGSNIGTCFTAIVASITATKNAKRVAYAHVILNVFGVIIFLPFIQPFSLLLQLISPLLVTQVAMAQIIFNVSSSFLALPFTNKFTNFLMKF
ncbi:MAG: Na/Pi symporter [Bacillota bacterium]|nr:Na/Pi symporter [Bacillota bacterium]